MSEPYLPLFEALHRAAAQATRGWGSAKASMALRAAGLDSAEDQRESLDAIASDIGVSRETVRRARNQLLRAILLSSASGNSVYSSLSLPAPSEPSAASPATVRALRRVLTMTGPLQWDEVLSAWARAGGKPPYSPLPADLSSMRAWATEAGAFRVVPSDAEEGSVTIATIVPEVLDQVSQFLLDALCNQPMGVDRNSLLALAEAAGLKPTTIATTLSAHPAVTRVGRGLWALRGSRSSAPVEPPDVSELRRVERVRPTTFSWGADGSLQIEFSIPRGPSPVVAVPKAVSEIVEAREFVVEGDRPARIAVKNARLWGFGPLLSKAGLTGGARATIALNLIAGTATFAAEERKGYGR